MSEQNTDNVVMKVAKRKSVTLTAGGGDKAMRLTVLARRTGSGGETTVTTFDAKKKATRGMTQKFDSFEDAIEALAKLVKRITVHGLRHTSATLLLAAGEQPNVVQRRLGHARVEMTLNIYSHVLPSMQSNAASRIATVLHR